MRNETVSVVIRCLDFLNLGDDGEHRSDCCFAKTARTSQAPHNAKIAFCSLNAPELDSLNRDGRLTGAGDKA